MLNAAKDPDISAGRSLCGVGMHHGVVQFVGETKDLGSAGWACARRAGRQLQRQDRPPILFGAHRRHAFLPSRHAAAESSEKAEASPVEVAGAPVEGGEKPPQLPVGDKRNRSSAPTLPKRQGRRGRRAAAPGSKLVWPGGHGAAAGRGRGGRAGAGRGACRHRRRAPPAAIVPAVGCTLPLSQLAQFYCFDADGVRRETGGDCLW